MNISLVMFCKLLLVIVLPPLAGCLLGRLAGKSLWRGAVLAAAIVLACLCTLRFLFFPLMAASCRLSRQLYPFCWPKASRCRAG